MNVPQPPIKEPIEGNLSIPWLSYFSNLSVYLGGLPPNGVMLPEYANDAAASAGGIQLYGYYKTGSIVKQRVV